MAYDLKTNVIGFQWIGEKSDQMLEMCSIFTGITYSQTSTHILRSKFNNEIVEVPLGGYLLVPDRDIASRFSLPQRIFNMSSKEIGGLQSELSLENTQVLFYQDYVNLDLESILKSQDSKAYVELDLNRFYCGNRFVSIMPNKVLIAGQDYVFTIDEDYCRDLANSQKLMFRDKKVIVDDASIVLIKTDATVIVDSQRKCSIYKRNLSNSQYSETLSSIDKTKEFINKDKEVGTTYSFSINDNSGANKVSLEFLRDNASLIDVEMTTENQSCMLKYILDALSMMLRKGSLNPKKSIVISMRINKFNFRAIYYQTEGVIMLTE